MSFHILVIEGNDSDNSAIICRELNRKFGNVLEVSIDNLLKLVRECLAADGKNRFAQKDLEFLIRQRGSILTRIVDGITALGRTKRKREIPVFNFEDCGWDLSKVDLRFIVKTTNAADHQNESKSHKVFVVYLDTFKNEKNYCQIETAVKEILPEITPKWSWSKKRCPPLHDHWRGIGEI